MTTRSLRVLLTAKDVTDSGFTPTTEPVCGEVFSSCPASLLSVMTVFHLKCLQSDLCAFDFFHRSDHFPNNLKAPESGYGP